MTSSIHQAVDAVDGTAETTRRNPSNSMHGNQGKAGTLINVKSNDSMPGSDSPGAFSRTASTTGAHSTLSMSTQQASPAVQNATQSTGGVLASTGQTAKQYLPVSVISTLEGVGVLSGPDIQNPNATSLPSQESSLGPTASGVSSAARTASEEDVTKLPEESVPESKIGDTARREDAPGVGASRRARDAGLGLSVGSQAPVTENQPTGGPSAAGTNTAAQFLDSSLQAVPSSSGDGTNLHRVTKVHTGTSPDSDVQATSRNGISTGEDRNKPLRPPGGNTNTLPDDAEGDNDTSYARDQGNRKPARPSPNHAYTPPGSSVELPTRQKTHDDESGKGGADAESSSGSGSLSPSTESGAKPSLKQKIKGEAKVLAGKIRNDPKKVEVGTALRTGHAVL